MCLLPFILTHRIPHTLPATLNLQASRRSGSLAGMLASASTPRLQCVVQMGLATWRGPTQLCRTAGGREWALRGWCVLGGAKCVVPHFSCMSPNSQLHTPVPHQEPWPFSPGCLQLPSRSWVCLEKARGNPCLEKLGMEIPPGYLTGALC